MFWQKEFKKWFMQGYVLQAPVDLNRTCAAKYLHSILKMEVLA